MLKSLINFTLILIFVAGCKEKKETIKPTIQDVTESVYASGVVKSKNQYQVFSTVSGVVATVHVKEGDVVKKGQPIFTLANEFSKLQKDNAMLTYKNTSLAATQNKLGELKANLDFAKKKMLNDSALYLKQKNLYAQQIGSEVELQQRELTYQNALTSYQSLKLKYEDLKQQLEFAAQQAKNNLAISQKQESDFLIKSEVDGMVYSINKRKGELVTTQTPIAIIGSHTEFLIELQVDEYDIVKIKNDQKVWLRLDSYKGKSYEARISRIYPIMNERTKTFTVEAEFVKQPEVLYPSLTLEANIIIRKKSNAKTLPRAYVTEDGYVLKSTGEKVKVETGLKDYQIIEIISGITETDELILP